MSDILEAIGMLVGAIVLVILLPFFTFIGGVFVGWCIKLIFPHLFLKGLGFLGLTIGIKDIPLFCGILGLIGGFFKSAN